MMVFIHSIQIQSHHMQTLQSKRTYHNNQPRALIIPGPMSLIQAIVSSNKKYLIVIELIE